MSEATVVTNPPPSAEKEVAKKGKGFFGRLTSRLYGTLGFAYLVIMWTFPPIIALVGWGTPYTVKAVAAFWPVLNNPVVEQLIGVIAVFCFAIIGILVQGAAANDDSMPVPELLLDNQVSGVWVGITWAVAAVTVWTGRYDLWYLIAPAGYAFVEFINGSKIGYRNAYQRVPYDSRTQRN
jgi:hypothetical protein